MNLRPLHVLLVGAILACTVSINQAQEAATPVPVESAVILSPANSHISFVGIHVGADPKPRLGGFAKFNGYVTVDMSSKSIKGINLDINVDSVWTEFPKLTSHLKNADFFETDKFPSSKFVSTGIVSNEAGQCSVTGDLTLHGETKSITFPAKFRFEGGGLIMSSKFKIDRSEFGMAKMLAGVDKLVSLKFEVGTKTKSRDKKSEGSAKK